MCAPLKPDYWYVFVALFLVATGVTLTFGVLCTVLRSPHVDDLKRVLPAPPIGVKVDTCSRCETQRYVPSRTHHCSWCSRCSDDFDHHCPWLNTCISGDIYGKRGNYQAFIGLVTSASAMFAVQISFAVYTAVFLRSTVEGGMIAGIVICTVLPLIALGGLLSVLAVQVWLRLVWGITTYEYLDRKAEAKMMREFAEEDKRREAKRAELEREKEELRREWIARREREERVAEEKKTGAAPTTTATTTRTIEIA